VGQGMGARQGEGRGMIGIHKIKKTTRQSREHNRYQDVRGPHIRELWKVGKTGTMGTARGKGDSSRVTQKQQNTTTNSNMLGGTNHTHTHTHNQIHLSGWLRGVVGIGEWWCFGFY
jgi:hypothetical protein